MAAKLKLLFLNLCCVVFIISVHASSKPASKNVKYPVVEIPLENPQCWISVLDGCGRNPARTKPPPTTPNPYEKTTPGVTPPTTTVYEGHQKVCTPPEVREAACLNGGDCFALEFFGVRSAHCTCYEWWTGKRCERIDTNIFVISADKVEKAGIAAGVVAIIIILTVIIIYLIVRKRKQRRMRAEENGRSNGHACKSLLTDQDNKMTSIELEEAVTLTTKV